MSHPVPKGMTNGCHCRECLDEHAARQRRYRAKSKVRADQMKLEVAAMQAELTALREWRDQMLATVPSSGERMAA